MELAGKNVLVFGSGISGIGATELLLKQGAIVTLYDEKEELDPMVIREEISDSIDAEENRTVDEETVDAAVEQMEIVFGAFTEDLMDRLDLVVLSPGVPTDLPVIDRMRDRGIPITGEVELAYLFGKGDVLAVTGTNGKTTTTTLLGEIMTNYSDNVFVVGNIGNPYTEVACEMDQDSIVVAEMSSFQLETIDTFRPKVSAILNITPDHMNRHHTMEAYVQAKENIARNQTEEDFCILNYEDERLREFGSQIKAQVVYFSSRQELETGIFLKGDEIIWRAPVRDAVDSAAGTVSGLEDGEEVRLCNVNELQILGVHNYENVMAAAAMAAVYGVPFDQIRESVLAFKGVPHRIEFVAEKNDVVYYNDSKATNPDAAIKAIQAMNRPTVLIGGGYDKQSTYTDWIKSFDGKVKKLILLGETKEDIAREARECGFTDFAFADSFPEAVEMAIEAAQPGDAVLLSPACASWDMFPNYEVRGDKFKELVLGL